MSIEDFKKKHSELEQAAKNYELNEQKRYEKEQELLSDMNNIASESERVSDVAHDVPKMLDKNSRVIEILTFVLIILEILIFAADYLVTSKLASYILRSLLVIVGGFIVKFISKLRWGVFDKIRNKIKG